MNALLEIDRMLLLLLNELHIPFWDEIMVHITIGIRYLAGYALLVLVIWGVSRHSWKELLWTTLGLTLVVFLTYQLSSTIMKPLVGRLRPCHLESLQAMLHVPVNCGGLYSFPSGHAMSSFGASVYLHKWFRLQGISMWLLYVYAALISYSRIYVGVHYPLDITCGAIIGSILGYGTCVCLRKLQYT